MFTGIIEALGTITEIIENGSSKTFWVSSSLSGQLKIDQSISHNGACLTVEEVKGSSHRVTAIRETLEKTNLRNWQRGESINLERCLPLGGRLDGHLVQGHVDTTATCTGRKDLDGSWEFRFRFAEEFARLVIEKGSICLNGISLTVFNVSLNQFSVAIIPYTLGHTNIKTLQEGALVNLEFDIIGKYVNRNLEFAGNISNYKTAESK